MSLSFSVLGVYAAYVSIVSMCVLIWARVAESDLNVHRIDSTDSHSAWALKPVAFEAGWAPLCLCSNWAVCLLPWQPAASTAAARKSHRSENAGGILKREALVQGWASVLHFCSYGALMKRLHMMHPVSSAGVKGCRPKSGKGWWEVGKKKKQET